MAKKIIKNTNTPSATRIFADRIEPRRVFWDKYDKLEKNFQNIEDIFVITYYGIGGIGKSALLKKLSQEMQEKNVYHILFDFETSQDPQTVMYYIKNQLERKYDFNFPKFDLAIYAYSIKMGKDADKPEVKSIIEQSKALSLITDAIGELPAIGMFSKIIKYADSGIALLKTYTNKNYKQFLEELESKIESESKIGSEILKELPRYFSEDLAQNIANTKKPLVILLDTYEKMVNEIDSDGYVLMKDMWLRGDNGIILHTPGVLWGIAGREKLKWGENDKDWEETLEQHRLGDLVFNDADEFLKEAGIVENDLREQIYELTNGTPVYLDLCVSTYEDLKRSGQDITIDKFGETKEELVERYVRYMNNQTREIVYMLAQLGNWNDETIYEVGKKVVSNFSIEQYETIKKLSFVYENNGEYYIHKTIADILNKKCPKIILERNSRILIDYLKQRLLKKVKSQIYFENKFKEIDRIYEISSRIVNDDNIDKIAEEIYQMLAEGKMELLSFIAWSKYELCKRRYGEKDEHTLKTKLEVARYFKKIRLKEEAESWARQTYETSLELYGEESQLTLDAKLWYLMTNTEIVIEESWDEEEDINKSHKKFLDMSRATYVECLRKYGRNSEYTIKALYIWAIYEPNEDRLFDITMEICKSCNETFGETNRDWIEKRLDVQTSWYMPLKKCEEKIIEEEKRQYKIAMSKIPTKETLTALDIVNGNKKELYGVKVKGYECESKEINEWNLFYADKDNIYLIAEDYLIKNIPNSTINDYSEGAKLITDAKVQALNSEFFSKYPESTNINMQSIAYILDTKAWKGFAGKDAEYAIGGPTIELFLKSYNEKYKSNYKAKVTSEFGYKISTDGGQTWKNTLSREERFNRKDPLYVIRSTKNADCMCVASPSDYFSKEDNFIVIDHEGITKSASHKSIYPKYAFRPVVCLKSGIILHGNEDGTYSIK